MHGYGVFKWSNDQSFTGYYENDKKAGEGTLKLCDGTLIKGSWRNGKLNGRSEVKKNGVKNIVNWADGV